MPTAGGISSCASSTGSGSSSSGTSVIFAMAILEPEFAVKGQFSGVIIVGEQRNMPDKGKVRCVGRCYSC